MSGFQKMEEIEFSRWLFWGRLRHGKNVLPDGLNWLCYFAGSLKSHRENSISFLFLESPHQVDMKNVVKSSKHFFGYFNTLETHSAYFTYNWNKAMFFKNQKWNEKIFNFIKKNVYLIKKQLLFHISLYYTFNWIRAHTNTIFFLAILSVWENISNWAMKLETEGLSWMLNAPCILAVLVVEFQVQGVPH